MGWILIGLLKLGWLRLVTFRVFGLFIRMGVLRIVGEWFETTIVLVIWSVRTGCTDMISGFDSCLVGW